MNAILLTAKEAWVIEKLRHIKSGKNGQDGLGHGILRVDVVSGSESIVKIETSERPPR